jgi:hypothetical protein
MPRKQSKIVALKSAPKKLTRQDDWESLATNLGAEGYDKGLTYRIRHSPVSEHEAEMAWRGDDMAARIIESLPGDMFREGFEVSVQDVEETPDKQAIDEPDAKAITKDSRHTDLSSVVFVPELEEHKVNAKQAEEAINALVDELEIVSKFREALEFSRAYGGGALLMGIRDGTNNLARPLNEENIESVEWLSVLKPSECVPTRWYQDPMKARYGQPEIYKISQDVSGSFGQVKSFEAHESRIIRFDGIQISRTSNENYGWGDSVLSRVMRLLRDFQSSWQAAGFLVRDFAQVVWKIKGLAQLLSSDESDAIIGRIRSIEKGRSVLRAIAIDEDEEWERKSTTLTGLPEMLEKFSLRLAAAARMPVSKLMGQAPAGLNATGDSDIRFYYDDVASERERVVRPRLNRLMKLLFLSKNGPTNGVEPANWTINFAPLWQLTELQQADLRNKQALTDKLYIDAMVLLPEEVAISRFGGDAYSTDTRLDERTRSAFDAESAKRETQMAEQFAQGEDENKEEPDGQTEQES